MDVSHIIDGLNDAQREAVTAPVGSALVLAGAGSGKTRVLVHRIAWLIQVEGLSPWGILAVTFTNKAAREMKNRVGQMLGREVEGMTSLLLWPNCMTVGHIVEQIKVMWYDKSSHQQLCDRCF